jgi:DNA-binding NtrC family response regulator
MAKIFVVDDELTMVQMVTEMLRAEGHEVFPFTNAAPALEALEAHNPDLVVVDMVLDRSRVQGLDVLGKARTLNPPSIVIVITGFGTVETAVDAMKKGAYDYLEKPFKLEDFKACVERALSYNKAVSENIYLRKQLKEKYQFNKLIGTSPRMQEIFKLMERVADTDSTVLVLGESGTGKELVARALHFNSRRHLAPFIPVNCAALPENLLESELFGHRKGAFTGAVNDKKGLFQEADGGTIFLDEIGSMPSLLQSRLLRVLQDGEVRRVGDNTPAYVNVRVLAATNEPLHKKIAEGTFREDLFYRLNVIPINVPPLRDRREDIPLIVQNYVRYKLGQRLGHPVQITKGAMQILCSYDWPGNVREVENVLERASVLCDNNIVQPHDLPPHILNAAQTAKDEEPAAISNTNLDSLYPLGGNTEFFTKASVTAGSPARIEPLKDFLREQEVSYLNRILSQTGGDKEKAAGILGISLATLYRKLSGEDAV